MNNNNLHWSFDYNFGGQENKFAQELLQLLDGYAKQTTDTDKMLPSIHVYQILPNFWRGYKQNTEQDPSLSIGTVIIERILNDDDLWNYNVKYNNIISGETLTFNFHCQNDQYRTLSGRWNVDVQNDCPDAYSNLACSGSITSENEIHLSVNDAEINIGTIDSSLPLTCNWSLLDVIPLLTEKINKPGDITEIILLDDLEQLRQNCKIGFLESIQSPFPLDGYYLYGTGMLPSYWWVDENKNISIVSSVFETLVLKQIGNIA